MVFAALSLALILAGADYTHSRYAKHRGVIAEVFGDRQRLAPILLVWAGRSLAALLAVSPRGFFNGCLGNL